MGGIIGGVANAAMGLFGAFHNAKAGRQARNQLNDLMGQDPLYGGSRYVGDMYGLAKTRLNSRMTGAAAAERNIYGAEGNTIANTTRLASDGSTALQMAMAAQGQAGQQFNDLRQQEGADYEGKYNAFAQANQGMTEEERFKYAENVRRWQDKVNNVMTQYKMKRATGNDFSQSLAGLGGMSFGGFGGGGGGGGGSLGGMNSGGSSGMGPGGGI